MDQRILDILKEVAVEHDEGGDMGCYCELCHERNYDIEAIAPDYMVHKSTCPTLIARTLLKELGTPLCVYLLSYEYAQVRPNKTISIWSPIDYLAASFDGKQESFDGLHLEDLKGYSRIIRNLQITKVRELG